MTLYVDTKPTLEWMTYKGRGSTQVYTALTSHYKYQVWTVGKMWTVEYVFGNYREKFDKQYLHLSDAQSAAQADYERRTMERFYKVELPEYDSRAVEHHVDYFNGYNEAIEEMEFRIQQAIKQAKEQS